MTCANMGQLYHGPKQAIEHNVQISFNDLFRNWDAVMFFKSILPSAFVSVLVQPEHLTNK